MACEGCLCCVCVREKELGFVEQFGEWKDIKGAGPPRFPGPPPPGPPPWTPPPFF